MVRARGASGPGCRLLLLLGLLAALRARDSRAAPRAAPGPAVAAGDAGAWPDAGLKAWEDAGGSGLPDSQLNLLFEHQRDARDEAVVEGYPSSRLDPVVEARGLPRRGPRVVEPRRDARGDGYRTFWRYPVLVPREDPRAVAVADGDPSSALEPGLVTPGHRGGVPVGSGLPASHLDAIVVPQGHARELPSVSQPGEAPHGRKYSFFPVHRGLGGGKDAEAAAPKGRQKQRLVLSAAVLGSVLFVVLLTCIVAFWLRKRKQEAVPANPAAASNRGESSIEEGRAKPGSDSEKDELTLENENLNSSSSRLPVNFATELSQLFNATNSESSFQPTCQNTSDGDYDSSSDICIPRDLPQADHSKCVCFHYQQGYCTSDAYSE
ncbi:uncharacterized protein LOC135324760 [Dromaius novaehollandiae]|uniref:uncharacterized protein LOC135324760 n=1 Tax=Dromaius novaehollandiae TaxID=8790 RepID=UPI00311D5763